MFSALLDTCVLVPSFLRDLLLELAASQAYRPVWSNRIEEELRRVLADLWHKKDLSPEHIEGRLERLLDQMNRAFPDAKLMIAGASRRNCDAQSQGFPSGTSSWRTAIYESR